MCFDLPLPFPECLYRLTTTPVELTLIEVKSEKERLVSVVIILIEKRCFRPWYFHIEHIPALITV